MSLGEQDLRNALAGKSTQELLAIFEAQGKQRKEHIVELAKFQTKDARHTEVFCEGIMTARNLREQKRGDYDEYKNSLERKLADARKTIDSTRAALQKAESELTSTKESGANSSKQVADCKSLASDVDAAMINKVNAILEEESPKELTSGLEALVCVLRNKIFSNNVDVELFFKSPEKLIAKLQRMEMRDADKTVIEAKRDIIKNSLEALGADTTANDKYDLSDFTELMQWGVTFCDGALIETKIRSLEEDAKSAKKAAMDAQKEFDLTARLHNELSTQNFFAFFEYDSLEFYDLYKKYTEIATKDMEQAANHQKKLHVFEECYFQEMIEKAQQKKSDPTANVDLAAGSRKFSFF